MFSLFQNRHPLAILFLVPMAALLSFLHFWFPQNEILSVEFVALQKSFELTKLDLSYLYFALLSVNAIALSTLFNRLNLIDYFSYVPGLFYLIFSFASARLSQIDLLMGEFGLILGVIAIVQIKNNADAKASVFLAALFFAIGVVLFPSFALLLVLPFIALARTRSFVLREYLLVFVAFAVVLAYLYFYYFYYDLKLTLPWTFGKQLVFPNYEVLAIYGTIFLLMLLSAYTRSRTLGSPGIRIQRIVTLMFSAVLLQLFTALLLFVLKTETVWHVGIFLALYTGYAYHFAKVKFVYHFLSYAVLLLGLLQHFEMF